jgi:hypothetical protein
LVPGGDDVHLRLVGHEGGEGTSQDDDQVDDDPAGRSFYFSQIGFFFEWNDQQKFSDSLSF